MKIKHITLLAIICGSFLLFAGCASLPDNSEKEISYVITDGENTQLWRSFSALAEQHPDQSGIILLGNGLDDMYGEEADDVWSALNTHPNMEVRLYNPFVRCKSKTVQFVTQLKRINHRMHSKTFTVDNQATIVGGRNIGDEYCDADKDVAFADLDEFCLG